MTTIHLLAPILKHRGTPLSYDHTDPARTLENLIVELETPPPTPSECEAVFGPSWQPLFTVIEAIVGASESERAAWGAAWGATRDATRGAALGAALDATRDAVLGAVLGAAWGATRDATRGATWYAAWDATRDAAWGATTQHLIGVGDYTREHYNTLVAPFESVFGKLDVRTPIENLDAI